MVDSSSCAHGTVGDWIPSSSSQAWVCLRPSPVPSLVAAGACCSQSKRVYVSGAEFQATGREKADQFSTTLQVAESGRCSVLIAGIPVAKMHAAVTLMMSLCIGLCFFSESFHLPVLLPGITFNISFMHQYPSLKLCF